MINTSSVNFGMAYVKVGERIRKKPVPKLKIGNGDEVFKAQEHNKKITPKNEKTITKAKRIENSLPGKIFCKSSKDFSSSTVAIVNGQHLQAIRNEEEFAEIVNNYCQNLAKLEGQMEEGNARQKLSAGINKLLKASIKLNSIIEESLPHVKTNEALDQEIIARQKRGNLLHIPETLTNTIFTLLKTGHF